MAAQKFQDATPTPLNVLDASQIIGNLMRPLTFRRRLEEKSDIESGDQATQGIFSAVDFVPSNSIDWLTIFEQREIGSL